MMAYNPRYLANDLAISLPANFRLVSKTAEISHREVAQPGRAPRSGQPDLPQNPLNSASYPIAQGSTERVHSRNKAWRVSQKFASDDLPHGGIVGIPVRDSVGGVLSGPEIRATSGKRP